MVPDTYLAHVTIFAGNFAPRAWAFCDGQLRSIAIDTPLFSLIGTTYGGDGQTTFALPDFRGRIPIHEGQGPGLSLHVLGEVAGSEQITITTNQMPAHTHTLTSLTAGGPPVSANAGTTNDPTGNVPAKVTGINVYNSAGAGKLQPSTSTFASSTAGGSQPVSILPPYLALNYVIAVEGIFPSRN